MSSPTSNLDLKPAAIEHIDRVLLDQTKGQRAFQAARDLLELDAQPCEAVLVVEFFDQVADKLAQLEQRRVGLRRTTLPGEAEMNRVWELRKAGLSLLTSCPGQAKPTTGIEDAAIWPERLPEYVASLRTILQSLGLKACFYGHAASGLLQVRPVLNLRAAEDRRKFRQVAHEVSALVRQFRGSLSAEHGVGLARTEFLAGVPARLRGGPVRRWMPARAAGSTRSTPRPSPPCLACRPTAVGRGPLCRAPG